MKMSPFVRKWSERTNIMLKYNDREVQNKPECVHEMHGDGDNP